jgi:sugar diacid utilization regulator
VKTEASLAFLAYNMKRVINILGAEEIIRRLTGKKSPINLPIFNFAILYGNIMQIAV